MARLFNLPASWAPAVWWKPALAITLTCAVYVLSAAYEQYSSFPNPSKDTIWWAAGWSVAFVFLFGKWSLPGVFLGELVINLCFFGTPWWLGFVTGTGTTIEAYLGAWILRRSGFTGRLNTIREVRILFTAAAILPIPMLLFQVPAFFFGGKSSLIERLPFNIAQWYTNDALAVVYVVPLATLLSRPKELWSGWKGRWIELSFLTASILLVTMFAFGTQSGHWFAGLVALSSFFLVWSAIRFDPATTLLMLTIHTATLALCIARGIHPFQNTDEFFPFLHLPMLMACLIAEFLAASVAERMTAERRFVQSARWEGLGAFAGGLAHEVNNQLTVILGATNLAESNLPPNSKNRELLNAVTESANKISELIGNLLAYAGRRVTDDAKPTDVLAVIREAVNDVNGNVQLDLSNSREVILYVDPTLLRLTIRNLLTNALESLPTTGGRVKVTVEEQRLEAEQLIDSWPVQGVPGDYLVIQVIDNGSGMHAEVVQRMFDPFFSTKFTGRGLGLAVVAGVIRQMHGFIRVQSNVGEGSIIEMNLPVKAIG